MGQSYDIIVEFVEFGGLAWINLSWSSPKAIPTLQSIPSTYLFMPGKGLFREYFPNTSFAGIPTTQVDPYVYNN